MSKTVFPKNQVMQFFKHNSRIGRLLHLKEQGVTFRLALFSVQFMSLRNLLDLCNAKELFEIVRNDLSESWQHRMSLEFILL